MYNEVLKKGSGNKVIVVCMGIFDRVICCSKILQQWINVNVYFSILFKHKTI